MGPKYGITAHRVLGAAGCPVGLTLESAASQIADNDIGWSYVDQSQACPALYRLLELAYPDRQKTLSDDARSVARTDAGKADPPDDRLCTQAVSSDLH